MNAKSRAALSRTKDKYDQMQQTIFPKLDESRIWDVKNRAKTKGFTSIPRTMPLIGSIMDALSGKGKPVAMTYLELWCRSTEKGFLVLSKPREVAFASGFSGERGVSTWKERVQKLEALNFISTQSGSTGDLHYVQIWNPYLIIKDHQTAGTEGFSQDKYNALLERSLDIGALDLREPKKEPA